MNVKAQGLINGAKWIEETYGQRALADVLQACSPEVRDRYISAIAINWHPLEELVEFLMAADRIVGRNDGAIAEEIGAAGARANMKSVMLRFVFYLSKPEFLMRRIAAMWQQFNDEGTMEIPVLESHRLLVKVSGCRSLPRIFVRLLTGWARVVTGAIAADDPKTRIVEHVERGNARCIWEITWTKSIEAARSADNV